MSQTKIEWATKVWNPVTGCTPTSSGCQNCYAKRMANRLKGRHGYPADNPFRPATYHLDRWPERIGRAGELVFVCSMGDLFHESVNIRGYEMERIFYKMSCEDCAFLLLTKRPERMALAIKHFYDDRFPDVMDNVWLGVSCENQEWADRRIPILLQIPAAVRFVSLEPLLGPIDLVPYLHTVCARCKGSLDPLIPPRCRCVNYIDVIYGVNWVVVGCESGPGRRPCKLEWVRSIVDQCNDASVPVFVKQIEINGKVSHDPNEWPEELRVREYPERAGMDV